jgi:hypothetical protein
MHLAGFEPTNPAIERSQTQALDCSATGIDILEQKLNFAELQFVNLLLGELKVELLE